LTEKATGAAGKRASDRSAKGFTVKSMMSEVRVSTIATLSEDITLLANRSIIQFESRKYMGWPGCTSYYSIVYIAHKKGVYNN
jgi:hypothetical protein